jgi:acetyl esterase/lipase
LNNENSRKSAAFDLVPHIIDYRQKNNITDEGITLIGHSHGGNVAMQAAHYLNDIYGITVNIVNLNTPAYNGSKDAENPQVGYGINQLVHYWTKQDGIAGGLAGDDKYKDGVCTDVTNVELNKPLKEGLLTSHFQENINTKELSTKLKKPVLVPIWQANPTVNKYDANWKPPLANPAEPPAANPKAKGAKTN